MPGDPPSGRTRFSFARTYAIALKQFVQMRKMLKAMGGLAGGKPDRKAKARLQSLMGRSH